MTDRMYVYEVAPDAAWLAAEECHPDNASVAVAVARWAGLDVFSGAVRWTALPGEGRVYWLGKTHIVSTVPLAWLPESTRRGFVTLGGVQ